jgi:hypothetical protein
MLELEAGLLEQHLEQHLPDQATVTRHLPDEVFRRCSNGARGQLGIPLPGKR